MKSDIDRLMAERDLDALVVFGPDGLTACNAAFAYMTGGANMTGTVVKRRGEPARLIYHPMEQEAAESSGLELAPSTRWDWHAFLEAHGGNQLAGSAARLHRILLDLGATGRVAFYGIREAGSTYALLGALQASGDVEVVGEFDGDILEVARRTKEPDEIAAIQTTSLLTCEVVHGMLHFLRSHSVGENEALIKGDGLPLTVGDVKAFLGRELAARDLEASDGTIFSIGADAGVPHSAGKPGDIVRLGMPVVLDIFPRRRGGYYTDLTRTFCLGYAPAAVREAHDEVRDLYEHLVVSLRAGEPASSYQAMACDYFEARGHQTIRQDRSATTGYTHSLGHGVGLQVHEDPLLSIIPGREDRLEPGMVFAVEPGLYYPARGFGIRVEDTIVCRADGTFQRLTVFPYDLVVPM